MKKHTWKNKKYRKVYKFQCVHYIKSRFTFHNEIKKTKICASCAKKLPDPNQPTLFT